MKCDRLWRNVHLATMCEGYGEVRNGAVAVAQGKIVWLGAEADLPSDVVAETVHDGEGCWLMPGLIDCHTHLVYAGNRSGEFEARLNGVAYADIARQGGGILSTVRATRVASEEDLLAASRGRLLELMRSGVTTLEIKSGYGLDYESERKMLRTANHIAEIFAVRVRKTFLGAHALPPEFAGEADAYIEEICSHMLPQLAAENLVDAVDAFCENIGFSRTQTEKLFAAAKGLGLPVKLHAEQLSDQDGAALTAAYQGLSADHLEYLSEVGIAAMAQAGTVAVLLPGAFYFLCETRLPPIAQLRAAGVPMAVSTDCNPGTSPLTSLPLAMNMACTQFRLTPLEALQGVTCHAARALGLQDDIGTLEVGKAADFSLWKIERPGELAYTIGSNPCHAVIFKGQLRREDGLF